MNRPTTKPTALRETPVAYRADGEEAVADILARKLVAEFFVGIGLVGVGLQRAGWTMAFGNDIDPEKFEMFTANFPSEAGKHLVGDIHHLVETIERVPTVALATASFPCNDLSLAGSRGGDAGKQTTKP